MESSDVPEPLTVLQQIALGSETAVQECLARHGGLVWALARKWTVNRFDAEDLAQEVFIDLWSNAKRFDPAIASESTFIAMIARRRMIDRKRKAGRVPQALDLPELVADSETSGFVAVDRHDEAALARKALDELSDDQRQVLRLSIDQGLTYDQIARQIPLPLGTVKSLARRGLIRLRQLLQKPSESQLTSTTPPLEETVS